MKIVRIDGGLGNQMFQYCFLKALEQQYPNENIYADISGLERNKTHYGYELEKVFSIKLNFCNKKQSRKLFYDDFILIDKIRRKLFGEKKTYVLEEEEDKFRFNENYLKITGANYFFGYWQTPRYFEASTKSIIPDFTFNISNINLKNKDILDIILNSNSISLHIRRGDYINHPLFGNICDKTYYQKAIAKINELTKDCKYFIFSDDIQWCKNNLDLADAIYIDWNTDENSFFDMFLISKCKNNIIANSSFSWWAAYLNKNREKIVISPAIWKNNMSGTRELIPENWIKI